MRSLLVLLIRVRPEIKSHSVSHMIFMSSVCPTLRLFLSLCRLKAVHCGSMGVVFIDWWKAVALPGFSVKIQAMPGSDGDIQNWS